MKPIAIEQAKIRLIKARRATSRLINAKSYEDAEDAWTDFLSAAAAIYSKLEQGCKNDGASGAWFGRKKKVRKDDELLRYLHQARNSDEHGIERVTEQLGRSWDFTETPVVSGPNNFGLVMRVDVHSFDEATGAVGDVITTGLLHGPTIMCVTVKNSVYHDEFPVPKRHLNHDIDFAIPHELALLSLHYFGVLIREAEELPKH